MVLPWDSHTYLNLGPFNYIGSYYLSTQTFPPLVYLSPIRLGLGLELGLGGLGLGLRLKLGLG